MDKRKSNNHLGDHTAVMTLLDDYFDGLYEGNVEKLRRVFHPGAWLKGNGYRKSSEDWLVAVADRPAPRDQGLSFAFSIQSIEIVGDQAVAKVSAPLPHGHFIDFLSLLKEGGEWKVVNKLFTML